MHAIKSTHKALVVPIKLEKHDNADALSLVTVGGWTVVVRTEDWKGVNKGVFVQPDSLVPNKPPFEFLFETGTRYSLLPDGTAKKWDEGEYVRITVRRFRGIQSFGLLVPTPKGLEIGDNAAEFLGVEHFEPVPQGGFGGDNVSPPKGGFIPVYDVEALKNYPDVIQSGERVSISEKLHGCSGKWCFREDKEGKEQMFVGSHRNWKKEDVASIWWRALKAHPEIEEFCKNNPDIVVYGEVYGQVQKGFEYDQKPGGVGIRVFDLYRNGKWIDVEEARTIGANLPWVPLIAHNVPFDMKEALELAEGSSTIEGAREDHIREGVVVKPMVERNDPKIGRVQLKVVGFGYLDNKSSKKRKKHQKHEKKDV